MIRLTFSGLDDRKFRKAVRSAHSKFWKMVSKWKDKPEIPTLEICISKKLRSNAGLAFCDSDLIRLNHTLLCNRPLDLKEIYGHELAHILAFHMFGSEIKNHGVEWQSVMVRLGLEVKETHTIPLSQTILWDIALVGFEERYNVLVETVEKLTEDQVKTYVSEIFVKVINDLSVSELKNVFDSADVFTRVGPYLKDYNLRVITPRECRISMGNGALNRLELPYVEGFEEAIEKLKSTTLYEPDDMPDEIAIEG